MSICGRRISESTYTMHRILLSRDSLRTLLRLSSLSCNRMSRRHRAWLSSEYNHSFSLFMESDLKSFLTPFDGTRRKSSPGDSKQETVQNSTTLGKKMRFNAFFGINREEACIRGNITLFPDQEIVKSMTNCMANYPPYDAHTPAPDLSNLTSLDPTLSTRIKEIGEAMWRAFCINDLLMFLVEGIVHEDRSMKFSKWKAIVDDSAVYRQSRLFQYVIKTGYPDELEAEENFLVYRKYFQNKTRSEVDFLMEISALLVWLFVDRYRH